MTLDAILSPLELPSLAARDLSGTTCVAFDVLRATSTFVTALNHEAREIIPVCEISEAVALREQRPDVLLAGERDGVRIRADQSGGVDFNFGNSPREFTAANVRSKTIISTTTNGTRALHACRGANVVLAASFLNLSATAKYLTQSQPDEVLLICAGTLDCVALEDVLVAGALADLLADELCDPAEIARQTFLRMKSDLGSAIAGSRNGQRLSAVPELRADVAFCAQRDVFNIVAKMEQDGSLKRA